MGKKETKKDVKKIDTVIEKQDDGRRIITYLCLILLIVLCVIFAQFFASKKASDTIISSISYTENAGVDYRVYYKEDAGYSEAYIGRGKTYISQYIDNINIDYSYFVNYTDHLNGKYNYYVQAKLVAFTPGDEADDLWNKVYNISEVESVSFNDDNSYGISKNVIIKYQDYVDAYNAWRQKSGVSSSAKLIVELIVENDGEYKTFAPIEFNSKVLVSIPISDASFKITTGQDISAEAQEFTVVEKESEEYMFNNIVSALCWALAAILVVCLAVVYNSDVHKQSAYTRKLKKILSTYDTILVNVEKMPSLTGMSVVDVTSFEELVDAQNEVRLPINFKEDTKRHISKFILIRNNMAWVYTLKEGGKVEDK